MKKTQFLTLVAAVTLFALASCKPTEDPLKPLTDGVTVTTAAPTYISGNTALCGTDVTVDDDGLLIEIGVCWSLSENPTIDNNVSKSYRCSQPYRCLLNDLEPETCYHVRGFVKYGTEYCYGEEKTFTTTNDTIGTLPELLTTTPAYDIYSNGFTSGGTLAPLDFNINFRFYGVCYSTSPTPIVDESDQFVWDYYYDYLDPLPIYVYGLEPNTQYYYRAFVGYGERPPYDYIYGDILSVTTPEIPLQLEVYTYSAYYYWYENAIEASGEVNCNKPEVIDKVGFCYSTENEYPQYESDLYVTAGTPTGTWYNFYSYIGGLSANNKYYIRSFARYLNDSIKYGNVVTVDTYKKD